MTKKTGRMSGGRAVLTELQDLDGKAYTPEIASCCLRLLAIMNIHGENLRKKLRDELGVLKKTLHISRDHPPLKEARASLKR